MGKSLETISSVQFGARRGFGPPNGNGEVNRGALPHGALGPCAAAMPGDDPAHIREADSRALELRRGMQPLEYAEELIDIAHVKADTVVLHEEQMFSLGCLGHGAHLNHG